MILVTRSDLNLSKGKLAAQCSHAATECVLKAKRVAPKILERYRTEGARKIVVSAKHLEGWTDGKLITCPHLSRAGYAIVDEIVEQLENN